MSLKSALLVALASSVAADNFAVGIARSRAKAPSLASLKLLRARQTTGGECGVTEKVCDDTCIERIGTCCNFGDGGYCELGYVCYTSGSDAGCCPIGKNCSGPPQGCSDGSIQCGEYCIPEDANCCDNSGYYCDSGETCTSGGRCSGGGNEGSGGSGSGSGGDDSPTSTQGSSGDEPTTTASDDSGSDFTTMPDGSESSRTYSLSPESTDGATTTTTDEPNFFPTATGTTGGGSGDSGDSGDNSSDGNGDEASDAHAFDIRISALLAGAITFVALIL